MQEGTLQLIILNKSDARRDAKRNGGGIQDTSYSLDSVTHTQPHAQNACMRFICSSSPHIIPEMTKKNSSNSPKVVQKKNKIAKTGIRK